MQISQMDIIKANIEYNAKGISNKDIARNILNEWRGSEPIKDMVQADLYYKVKNTNIDNKTRDYVDENERRVENKYLSNVKSKTAQYRKSVNQKYNFALAKPFVISCDNDNYKEAWEEFLNDDIRKVIGRIGKDGINKGIGWAYPWINELGELEIIDIQPETIYPAWKDTAHTELDALVRDYTLVQYINLTATEVRKVEYWDREIVERYIDYSQGNEASSGDLVPDTDIELQEGDEERTSIQQTHMSKANGEGISWNRVPFLFFKGCDDELPLLNECKTDIDNYDMVKSKAIDSILDDIDAVLVIENVSPEMGELARARKLMQNSRIVSVDQGGNAHFEKVNSDISSIAQQLEIIRKDIQDNTNTVDLTTIQLGTNPSGQSMKSFFEALNTWCNGFETEFRVFMKNLKYFFDLWLSWKGGFGTFEELQDTKVTFTLDRDMMINEVEILDGIVKMADLLSQETLDEMNPWVENHQKEQKRREEDMKKQQQYDELYKMNEEINHNENEENTDNYIDENEENQ